MARREVKSLGVLLSLRLASAFGQSNLLDADPNSPTFNNPSFERPDITFVSIVADKWELTGPQTIVDIPPFGSVPIVAGCGIFENPPNTDPRWLAGADGTQIAYIFANSFHSVVPEDPVVDQAFTQRTQLTLQAGTEYGLTIGFANATAVPPPESILTMSLFAFDPNNPSTELLLASDTITSPELDTETLFDFPILAAPVSGAAIGKQIGIRINTHTDPDVQYETGQFDFDNVRLFIPEPQLYWDGNGAVGGAGAVPAGTWGISSNWTTSPAGTSPTAWYAGGLSTAVYFSAGSDATGSFTVTVSGSQSAGSLHFRNGAVTLTGGQITLGTGEIDVAAGSSATISSLVAGTAGLRKSVALNLDSDFASGGTVTISGGVVRLLPKRVLDRVIKTSAILITSGSLDLGNNKLIVTTQDSTGTWNGSAYTGVTALVASGKGTSNLWDGATGIVTSQTLAVGSNYHGIGVALASDVRPNTASETALWGGQTITGTDTLVMYTYGGDANLDGKLNIDDYVKIDQGIASGLQGWSNGDFNYDGKINIDDYTTVIDSNIGNQNGFVFSAASMNDQGNAAIPVPEPDGAAIPLAMFFVSSALKRRAQHRRHRRRNVE